MTTTAARPGSTGRPLPAPWSCAEPGSGFARAVLRTPWLTAGDDLGTVLRAAADRHLGPGVTVCVSEKVAVLLGGGALPATSVVPGRTARLLARAVHPVGASRGLSVPEKMQLVLRHQGRGRVLLAAGLAALTRPLGWHGVFYRVAGRFARDLDGMRGAYEDLLVPPLTTRQAVRLVERLAGELDVPVAVVDINDRGGSVRAVSAGGPAAALVHRLLRDNPMGQGDRSTPVVLLRDLRPTGTAGARRAPR